MPFTGDVVVREISDDSWRLVEPLEYWGNVDRFVIEAGFETDFASVPKIFTWLLPRYGKYTKAAILHDWLCARARKGLIPRCDADGIFRRSMRELGVPFLRRWLMWTAVRLDAAKHGGPGELFRPSAASLVSFLAVATFGLAYVLVPAAVILLALVVFFLAEWIAYLPLAAASRWRKHPVAPPVPAPARPADDIAPAGADAPMVAAGGAAGPADEAVPTAVPTAAPTAVPTPAPAAAPTAAPPPPTAAVPEPRKAVNRPHFTWAM